MNELLWNACLGALLDKARRMGPMKRFWAIMATAAFIGCAAGWFGHAFYASAEAGRPCREEVISVDGAHGAVSCSHGEQTGELKDGYLVCRCTKKK
jgi:hypothetical protein